MLRLSDTALGQVVDAVDEPAEHPKVSMYVCGPTVYDVPHLGHGRFSLVFDVLRRYLEWKGHEVVYVSNVTDVDDNIIKRANEEGRSAAEVVAQYEALWWEVMDRLGVKRPTVDPHATAYVERMIDFVGRLVDSGFAYETSDGVYFAAEKVDDYGLLARQSLESLRSGAGHGEVVTDEKRSPVDFALWKKAKPGEPSWPSPWGDGRPGWHTECVVMSADLLGETFDIHGGGQDLAFPHHENERAQARAVGWPFARHWVHNGWVVVEGEKMSKSLANFTSLTDLLDRTDPRAYRLLVLRAHYRSPVEVTPGTTADASEALRGLDNFARRTAALVAAPLPAEVELFRRAMDDDLDTPKAVARMFHEVRQANAALDEGNTDLAGSWAASAREVASALGLELQSGDDEIDAEAADLVAQRDAARKAKDYAAADSLRYRLQALGWAVEDTPEGTKIHR